MYVFSMLLYVCNVCTMFLVLMFDDDECKLTVTARVRVKVRG